MEKFIFVVDCIDKKSCKMVRQHMKENGYKYIRELKGTLSGDHSAIMYLPSLTAARKEARVLHKKYIDEIRQISIV